MAALVLVPEHARRSAPEIPGPGWRRREHYHGISLLRIFRFLGGGGSDGPTHVGPHRHQNARKEISLDGRCCAQSQMAEESKNRDQNKWAQHKNAQQYRAIAYSLGAIKV